MGSDVATRTVVFADLVGFTAATDIHGDETAVDLARRLASATIAALPNRGLFVKAIGDATLCTFDEPIAAVGFVDRLLQIAAHEPDFPALCIGLDHGPVLAAHGDIFGSTVNIASRLSSAARPGQVLATSAVASSGLPIREVISLGPMQLRNISDPIEVFDLRFSIDTVERRVDPICQMLVRETTALRLGAGTNDEQWFCSRDCLDRFRFRRDSGRPLGEGRPE